MSTSMIDLSQLLMEHDFYRVRPLKELSSFKVIGEIVAHRTEYTKDSDVYLGLQQIGLPNSLVCYLKGFIHPIYQAYNDWYGGVKHLFDNDKSQASRFVAKHGLHWKWCGIVDNVQMARAIVFDESMPMLSRFYIACEYCSVTDIHLLWVLLSEAEKENCGRSGVGEYWRLKLTNGPVDEYQFGMCRSCDSGNLSALAYFWNLMADRRHRLSMLSKARASVLVRFSLLKLRRLFLPSDDISALLAWPWVDLFIPAFNASGLTPFGLQRCLLMALRNLPISEFNQPELFTDIILMMWSLIDEPDRNDVFSRFLSFLYNLFSAGFTRCLKTVLKDLSPKKLQEMGVFDGTISRCCGYWILNRRLDVVEVVLDYMLPKEKGAIWLFANKLTEMTQKMIALKIGNTGDATSEVESLVQFQSFVDDYLTKFTELSGDGYNATHDKDVNLNIDQLTIL